MSTQKMIMLMVRHIGHQENPTSSHSLPTRTKALERQVTSLPELLSIHLFFFLLFLRFVKC